jgi:KDO2-lipid IV(A) lauroyltransferase
VPTNHDTSSSLLLYRAGARLARTLPRPVAVALGRGIAQVFRLLGPARRAAVRANLARLRPGADARARDRLVAATYAAFAESLIDAWRLDLRPGHTQGDAPTCTVVGAEALRALLDGGRGVVLWSAHFGNWELAAAALAREGFDVAALARPHADPGVDRFFAARRAAAGVRIVGRCPLARGARETLGDRRFGGAGQAVALCGGSAALPAAPVALARRTGAAIVPGFVERIAPGRWRVTFEPALEPGDTTLSELARALERRILADPTQWFVFERIWDDVQAERA